MAQLAYTVTATLPDQAVAQEYIDWLLDGHIQAVIAGGAVGAEVARLAGEGPEVQVESRYRFPDRSAFVRYEREHAPALRADGQRRFGGRPGVGFQRRVGEILTAHDPAGG